MSHTRKNSVRDKVTGRGAFIQTQREAPSTDRVWATTEVERSLKMRHG